MRARPKWGPSHQEAFRGKKKPVHQSEPVLCWHYLSSRAVARKVLSAQMSLTSVFGMGTGGPSPQSTPTREEGLPFFMLKARGPQRWSILTRLPAFVKPFFLFFCRPFLLPVIAQRGGTDGPVPSLALRASVHTGAAIRTPCGRAWQNATFPGEYKKHCGFPPAKRSCHADRQQVSACHCEERSDVAIRNSCGRA